MISLKPWRYLSFGALALASIVFAWFLLSEHSYELMRWFYRLGPTIATVLLGLGPGGLIVSLFRRRRLAIAWLVVIILSAIVVLSMAFARYEVTAIALFDRQSYYLVKFLQIDSYTYRVYRCETSGFFCHRSSGYIGIPDQHISIRFQQDLNTKKVYIRNGDRAIEIPD
jgi:hypothetical protein